jgi:methyltransferase (TIGR00027 family)
LKLVDGIALRSKYFDEFFRTAGDAGIRQSVILASGLDSRAYRLAWPAGTTVYEIDQPQVIDFKTSTLSRLGVNPSAQHHALGVDLRDDWSAALQETGWNADEPTAWCAEGLLIYLPPGGQDQLFDSIIALSAPASRIATDFAPGIVDLDAERVAAASTAMAAQGLNMNMRSLIYPGPRRSAMDYLGERGWEVTATTISELYTRNGLAPREPDPLDPLGEIVYVDATAP